MTPAIPAHADNRPHALALRFLSVTAFTSMAALIKVASERGVSLSEILFWRQAGAVPIILIWVAIGPGLASLRTSRFRLHVGRSTLGLISMSCMFTGVSMLPLAESTILSFTTPIFATIMAAVLLHETVGWRRWVAVLAGFAGVVIMVAPGSAHFPVLGASFALIAALLSALVLILLRDMSKSEPPATIAFWFSVLSLAPLGILMLRVGTAHTLSEWMLLFAIGGIGAVGQLAMTSSLKKAPVSTVVAMDYTALIWSTLYGALFWSVLPTPSSLLGAPVIIASGLFIVWRERQLHIARSREITV